MLASLAKGLAVCIVLGLLWAASFLLMARTGGGRRFIDVENRSGHTLYVYEIDQTDRGMEPLGTATTRVDPGKREGVAASHHPVGCWMVFLGNKGGKPLAVVRVAPEDRRGEDYVVVYPSSKGRLIKTPPDLSLPWSGS